MTARMMVRAENGSWERLEAQSEIPDGGFTQLFGDDVGPVLGSAGPLMVVAAAPVLPTGTPDAICVDLEGNISIVAMALSGTADATLPQLLGYAGALHGMELDAFEALCNRVNADDGGVAAFVHTRNSHAEFHQGTFDVAMADALASGRFRLISIASNVPSPFVQSLRYLNASGADVSCFEASIFASSSVMAMQVEPVDVGQVQRIASEARVSAAGMVAMMSKGIGDTAASMLAILQKACMSTFDEVSYGGDAELATMSATIRGGDGASAEFLSADTTGVITLDFESLGDLDPEWTVRAELAQSMSRMLGAELGNVKKISQLNLDIREHLLDATLMEALGEILSDTVTSVRAEGEQAAASGGAVGAAA